MKIQKGGSPKGPAKITASAPSTATLTWEPYFERMREFERSMMRRFFESSPWRMEFKEPAPFEMRETEQGYVVSAAMPGFDEGEIEVRVEPWRMYLHAKHEESAEKGKPVFEEHREITRWIEFPAEVNPEKANAVLAKGVLEVTLEKAQTARRIQVRSRAA